MKIQKVVPVRLAADRHRFAVTLVGDDASRIEHIADEVQLRQFDEFQAAVLDAFGRLYVLETLPGPSRRDERDSHWQRLVAERLEQSAKHEDTTAGRAYGGRCIRVKRIFPIKVGPGRHRFLAEFDVDGRHAEEVVGPEVLLRFSDVRFLCLSKYGVPYPAPVPQPAATMAELNAEWQGIARLALAHGMSLAGAATVKSRETDRECPLAELDAHAEQLRQKPDDTGDRNGLGERIVA